LKHLIFSEIFRVIIQNAAKNLKVKAYNIIGNVRRMVGD